MAAPRPGSAFVPHDLEAPIFGADTGPLAGLTCAVKDMYDIAGYRTGGGSPDWLAAAQTANASAATVCRVLDAGRPTRGCAAGITPVNRLFAGPRPISQDLPVGEAGLDPRY